MWNRAKGRSSAGLLGVGRGLSGCWLLGMHSKHHSPQPEQLTEASPSEDPPIGAELIFSTAMDEEALADSVPRQFRPVVQAIEHGSSNGLAGFDFDRHESTGSFQEIVHFVSVPVPPEGPMAAEPCGPSRLDELGDDERLEDAAPEIMLTELVGCLQAELDNLSI